jgi:hypothetical protein
MHRLLLSWQLVSERIRSCLESATMSLTPANQMVQRNIFLNHSQNDTRRATESSCNEFKLATPAPAGILPEMCFKCTMVDGHDTIVTFLLLKSRAGQ